MDYHALHRTPFVFPNDAFPAWSIMIVLYPYITGMVAGAFVVSTLYHVFGRKALEPVARLAVVTSLCFCLCATLPLLLHLHQPFRALNVVATPSPTSAMAGFGFIYSFYLLILVVEVWLLFRPAIVARAASVPGRAGKLYRALALGVLEMTPGAAAVDRRLVGILSVVGIPAACILHGYVGFLFGAIKANPWWSTSLMPVIFLASAVASGIAVLILIYLFLCRRSGIAPDDACMTSLSRMLWGALLVATVLESIDILHVAYEREEEWYLIRELVGTKLRFSYLFLQVLLGSVLPLAMLPVPAFTRLGDAAFRHAGTGVAAVLVLVQVLAMRWNVVVGGQLFSKSFRGFVDYPVTVWGREGIVAALVVAALPLVLLAGAMRLLPVWPPVGEEDAAGTH
jgi:Ni/Fe-hydrogenase subunit HybB-like protein